MLETSRLAWAVNGEEIVTGRAETDRWMGFGTGGPPVNVVRLTDRWSLYKVPRGAGARKQAKTITTETVRVHPALRTQDRDRFRRRAFRRRPVIDGGPDALSQALPAQPDCAGTGILIY